MQLLNLITSESRWFVSFTSSSTKCWQHRVLMTSLEIMGNTCCCVQVDQSTVAIKEKFGKFEDVLEPGCHCLPWHLGSQLAGHLSLRVQQLDVRCETKTKVHLLPQPWTGTVPNFFIKRLFNMMLSVFVDCKHVETKYYSINFVSSFHMGMS